MAVKSRSDHAITTTDLKAPASDNTFAGVMSFMRRKYTKDILDADAVVWGIPLDTSVSNRSGARFGPAAIRRASSILDNDPQYPFNMDIFEDMAVVDYGDCQISYSRPWDNPPRIENEARELLKNDSYLLTLGGDHFISGPLLRVHAEKYGPLAMIQFDAHQDTWSDDGEEISHGNFVTRAVREGIIDPERSIQIGIRTHAPEDFGIEILYGDDVEDMTSEEIAAQIKRRVGDMPCYITFDIDCLDCASAPGTGTPVAGGPSSAKILAVLRKLGSLDIKGSDVVEVAPAYDHADITAIAASTVAMYMLGLQAEKLAES